MSILTRDFNPMRRRRKEPELGVLKIKAEILQAISPFSRLLRSATMPVAQVDWTVAPRSGFVQAG
jgi:hypothetical protein